MKLVRHQPGFDRGDGRLRPPHPEPEGVCGSAMVLPEPLKTRYRKLTAAALLVAVVSGYVLVWVHAEAVHGSTSAADKCVVCSWAKNLATIGSAQPGIILVRPAGRMAPPSLFISRPFSHRLSFSARSPPGTV